MAEENRVRLRASCNACNESKVRCSQRKPTCTRCERNQIECIYGLSRRTHKDAPPISIPPSQRGKRASRPQPSGDTRTSTSPKSNSSSKAAIKYNGSSMSEGPDEAVNNNTNPLNDYMYSTPIDISSMYGPTPLLDFNSLSTESTTSATMAPGYFPTPDATPFLDSLFSANLDSDCMDMGPHQAMNGESECNCHEGVTELLVCMRGAGKDQRLSLDAQLARLKQCTVSSEVSMGCTHPRDDSEPIHIMAVAMLIGYAIDDFKTLASESSLRRSTSSQSTADMVTLGNTEKDTKPRVPTPNSSNMSLRDLMEPRLSLGVLELEEDDEMDLRQRLYQLSFRKLERLLSQLTVYLRDLHSDLSNLPDPSRHMAFVIACDYTRLWLERKASDVKRLFSVPSKDETMDSAIV